MGNTPPEPQCPKEAQHRHEDMNSLVMATFRPWYNFSFLPSYTYIPLASRPDAIQLSASACGDPKLCPNGGIIVIVCRLKGAPAIQIGIDVNTKQVAQYTSIDGSPRTYSRNKVLQAQFEVRTSGSWIEIASGLWVAPDGRYSFNGKEKKCEGIYSFVLKLLGPQAPAPQPSVDSALLGRLSTMPVKVLVVGDSNAGKSTAINSLVGSLANEYGRDVDPVGVSLGRTTQYTDIRIVPDTLPKRDLPVTPWVGVQFITCPGKDKDLSDIEKAEVERVKICNKHHIPQSKCSYEDFVKYLAEGRLGIEKCDIIAFAVAKGPLEEHTTSLLKEAQRIAGSIPYVIFITKCDIETTATSLRDLLDSANATKAKCVKYVTSESRIHVVPSHAHFYSGIRGDHELGLDTDLVNHHLATLRTLARLVGKDS